MSRRSHLLISGLLLVAVLLQCLPRANAASLVTTAPDAKSLAAVDPLFKEPFIDVDEWRDAPTRHRYVHGGFKGTDTR